jgi:hypothetical protein
MRVSFGRRAALAAVAVTSAVCAAAFAAAPSASTAVHHDAMRAASAPNHKVSHSSSTNWAGYAVYNGTFTSVSASWTQPAVSCSVTPTGWSSFWVGLDGYNTSTVEQTGTEADCSSGSPVYSAWYEMYPKFPKTYSDAVSPGDHFTASVTTDGNGNFTLNISDTSKGWSHSTRAKLRSARLGSAEVIAEAPSSSGGVLPLTDFGTVNFSSATVDGQAIGTFNPDRIDMVSNGITKATTSALSGGNAFFVTWQHS